jgi:hypothetical protein
VNWSRDLPTCSIVLRPTTLPRAPNFIDHEISLSFTQDPALSQMNPIHTHISQTHANSDAAKKTKFVFPNYTYTSWVCRQNSVCIFTFSWGINNNTSALWGVMPRKLVESYRRFRGTCCLHLQSSVFHFIAIRTLNITKTTVYKSGRIFVPTEWLNSWICGHSDLPLQRMVVIVYTTLL